MGNCILLGELDDAAALLAEQRDFVEGGPPTEQIGVSSTSAWLAHVREDFDALPVYARELLELAETIGDERRAARAHLWLAYVDHQELRAGEAREHYLRCLTLSERVGHVGEQITVALNLGTLNLEVGRAECAMPHLRRALELSKQIGTKTLEGYALAAHARALLLLGRLDEALAPALDAVTRGAQTGEKALMASAEISLGAIEIASGALESGIARAAAAAAIRREMDARETLLENLAIVAEGLILARRLDEAKTTAQEMASIAASRRVVPTRTCLAVANVARACGDRANAFKWSQRGKSSLEEYAARLGAEDREPFMRLPWNRELAEWA
jgi:hypothetical protein